MSLGLAESLLSSHILLRLLLQHHRSVCHSLLWLWGGLSLALVIPLPTPTKLDPILLKGCSPLSPRDWEELGAQVSLLIYHY